MIIIGIASEFSTCSSGRRQSGQKNRRKTFVSNKCGGESKYKPLLDQMSASRWSPMPAAPLIEQAWRIVLQDIVVIPLYRPLGGLGDARYPESCRFPFWAHRGPAGAHEVIAGRIPRLGRPGDVPQLAAFGAVELKWQPMKSLLHNLPPR
jgi:hypothetical protein